jgi:hypothetical protein
MFLISVTSTWNTKWLPSKKILIQNTKTALPCTILLVPKFFDVSWKDLIVFLIQLKLPMPTELDTENIIDSKTPIKLPTLPVTRNTSPEESRNVILSASFEKSLICDSRDNVSSMKLLIHPILP